MLAKKVPTEEIIRRGAVGVAEGLNAGSAEILAGSLQHTPMLTGDLRSTGQRTRASADNLKTTIHYGGAARSGTVVVYAAAQHEGKMTYRRKDGTVVRWEARRYTTPGTGPKYLENEVKAMVPRLPFHVARGVAKAYGDRPGSIRRV